MLKRKNLVGVMVLTLVMLGLTGCMGGGGVSVDEYTSVDTVLSLYQSGVRDRDILAIGAVYADPIHYGDREDVAKSSLLVDYTVLFDRITSVSQFTFRNREILMDKNQTVAQVNAEHVVNVQFEEGTLVRTEPVELVLRRISGVWKIVAIDNPILSERM